MKITRRASIEEYVYDVDIGGIWETYQWEIQLDVPQREHSEEARTTAMCPHCYYLPIEITKYSDRTLTSYPYKCPRVVVGINEGGHASTGVCLDCILEAASILKEMTK